MKTYQQATTLAALFAATMFAVGCGEAEKPAPAKAPAVTAKDDHGHEHDHDHHAPGPHDGVLADWGGGKFHVEFCVDHDKQEATVYVLGSDEKTAAPIKVAEGKLLLTIKDPSFQVELQPQPLDGEAEGTCSRFVGKHEKLGKVQEFSGTISGEVDGTPYAGDFAEEPHGEHGHEHKKK